ncbi:MAG: hypothetical protein AB7O43_04995 [Hyphomicrobiaceae bacterium]
MTNWSIDFSPMIPAPLFWAGAALAVLLVIVLLFRRSPGALLRALALGLVVLSLANPTLKEEERENLGNVAIVMMDESTSQTLADRPQQSEAIRRDLEAKLAKIKGLEVKWVSAARPSDTRGGTNLFADLNQALTSTPPDRLAGVIMITDGQVHDVPTQAAALGFDAPVHALLTGRPGEFDRRIEIVNAPKFGIVGQTGTVEVAVREMGRSTGTSSTVTLRIRREGQADELRRAEINRKVALQMPFPHAGQNILEIELPAAPGELTAANNRVVVTAEGVRENLRVLLVSGKPHAGERTWRNLLKSDAAVDLIHFTILRPPEKQDSIPTRELSLIQFPTRELFSQKIKDFDLIIFDRYQHRGILQALYYDNIAQYVRQGGALLVAAGDDYAGHMSLIRTMLAPVLPARPTGSVYELPFKAKLTADGRKHPVTRDLPGANAEDPPWGKWYRQVDVSNVQGRVIMSGASDKPLLILDRKGKGRVALLTSDHAWLWARGHDGGGPHTDLLRRLAHWLMKEPDLEEERLIASAKGLKLTVERRSMEPKVQPITMSAPGGANSRITLDPAEPGVWRSTIEVKEPGLYKLQTASSAGQLTAVALAGVEDPREMSEVTATDAKLKPLVGATGGGVFWTRGGGLFSMASGDAVEVPRITMMSGARVLAGSGWMGLKDREAYVTRGIKLTPMFTGLLALAALLFFITLAWWREGK